MASNELQGQSTGQSTRGRFSGTGYPSPRFGGTAPMDNLAARMKNWVMVFPHSVKVVDRRGARKAPGVQMQTEESKERSGA